MIVIEQRILRMLCLFLVIWKFSVAKLLAGYLPFAKGSNGATALGYSQAPTEAVSKVIP